MQTTAFSLVQSIAQDTGTHQLSVCSGKHAVPGAPASALRWQAGNSSRFVDEQHGPSMDLVSYDALCFREFPSYPSLIVQA